MDTFTLQNELTYGHKPNNFITNVNQQIPS